MSRQTTPLYLRAKPCAAALSIGVSTLYSWAATGRFDPGVRIGGVRLWSVEKIKAFVEARV